jgi:hypothetical protein
MAMNQGHPSSKHLTSLVCGLAGNEQLAERDLMAEHRSIAFTRVNKDSNSSMHNIEAPQVRPSNGFTA